MREILFRGIKTETKGEWIEGYFKIMHGKCYIANYDYSPFEVEVYEHTVSQFTGLADKNGVKIFEGDIIKTDDNDIINVSYGIQNIDAFETIGFNLFEFYGNFKDIGKAIRLQNSIEIIGNIHE